MTPSEDDDDINPVPLTHDLIRLGSANESLDESVVSGIGSDFSEPVSDAEKEIHEYEDSDTRTNFLLANARSLAPKITSLIDSMSNLRCDFAMITETWFKGGAALNAELSDIEQATGVKLLCRHRQAGRKSTGGGVALAFNVGRCNLKKKSVKSKHEILCVTGKIAKILRPFAIFTVYIPPDIKVADLTSLCEDLATAISGVMSSLKDPVLIVGGDLNRRDISPAFETVDNMVLVQSGPTRGPATLDHIYTNANYLLTTGCAKTFPPLEADDGRPSDHGCLFAGLDFPKLKDFTWEKVTVRLRSDDRDQAFLNEFQAVDWNFLADMALDDAVSAFENLVGVMTNRHFPHKTFRRRSNEKPWITNAIRRKSRRKRRLFRKHGRSRRWKTFSKALEDEVRESMETYVEDMISKGRNGKDFFAAVRRLSKPNSAGNWSVTELFPNDGESTVCDKVIEYFATVGGTEEGPVPAHHDVKLPAGLFFTTDDVTKRLSNLKRTDSHVEGDPLPHLVRAAPALFSVPATIIFNKASLEGTWPKSWKTEHLTIIPKTKNPASLAETRNISCTSLLSKVLEGALLEKLRSELEPDPHQYGGVQACGVEHLLVDIWDAALGALDSGQDAAVVLGVDFQKAFNRMEYKACLDQLEKLGASPGSLCLVRSFLEDRRMTIRIGSARSTPRRILRGSPQGSVIGCMLYCVTTQNLGDPRADTRRGQPSMVPPAPGPCAAIIPVAGLPRIPTSRGSPLSFFAQDVGDDPVRNGPAVELDAELDLAAENTVITVPTPPLNGNIGSFCYVDDTTLLHKVPLSSAIRHCTTGPTIEMLDLSELETRFIDLIRNAEEIGMKINCAKTQLLVLSPNNGCQTVASLSSPEGPVESIQTLKLVGFVFGDAPNVAAHVNHILERFRIRVWLLYHLREAGIKDDRLFMLYCVYIRSIIEFCSPVYHSMLSRGQAEALERLQRHAGRICYGDDPPIRETFAAQGVRTLEERRVERVDKFIMKALGNPRFRQAWFPRRNADQHQLRSRRAFEETVTRTWRAHNGPKNYFVRRANELGLD